MSLLAALALLQLIIPTIIALPANHDQAMPRDGCDIGLRVAGPTEVQGEFEGDGWMISFHAVLRQDVIYSMTTLNIALSGWYYEELTTQLSFPAVQDRVIPQIAKVVVEAAAHVAESTACNIPDGLNQIYENLADRLYKCTEDMGRSQLRFSVMYHETIIGSAKRICSGAETICTPSPEYVYSDGLFICSEDLEELYPGETAEAKIRMEEIKQRGRQQEEQGVVPGKGRVKREWWCPCGSLRGSDWGCCGNYDGCCWVCSDTCYIHDEVCTNCDHWHCGPACVPDRRF